jgi:deoxyadenosine/deoxycytidine kinase
MKYLPPIPYQYLCIEGNIGAGKTSLATRISEDYHTRLILERFEDNSFLPKFYAEPEKYAFPLELSFMAERYQQMRDFFSVNDLFMPRVVSDYLFNKSMIFSRKTLNDDLFKLYFRLFHIMSSTLPRPDLMVYLYLHTEKLCHNIKERGRPYEKGINTDYLHQIQMSYLDYIKNITDIRVLIIDTNELDFVKNNSDYLLILELLSKDYPKGVSTIIHNSKAGLF